MAEVYLSIPEGISVGEVFPNPVVNGYWLMVNSSTERNIGVEMMDMLGRTVRNADYVLKEGDNTITMDVQNITAGSYIVRLTSVDHVIVKKFIKE